MKYGTNISALPHLSTNEPDKEIVGYIRKWNITQAQKRMTMTFVGKWMDLETMMLNEINLSPTNKG